MDNISDIVILLVMVVATIIGALSKSKKKEDREIPSNESIWEKEYTGEATESKSELGFEESMYSSQSTNNNYISMLDDKPLRSSLKVKVEVESEPETLIDQEHIADNFDLRKAVIYSEILKPKFEEL